MQLADYFKGNYGSLHSSIWADNEHTKELIEKIRTGELYNRD